MAFQVTDWLFLLLDYGVDSKLFVLTLTNEFSCFSFHLDWFGSAWCEVGSSFRRSSLWQMPPMRALWYSLYNGWKIQRTKFRPLSSLVFIGNYMVTINANPMRLVQSILYWPCTRRIGFAPIVTILSPIKTKDFTHVFFLLLYNLYHRLQEIHEKKHTTDRRLFTKPVILERMKLDSAVRHYCLSQKIKCTCRKLSWWRSLWPQRDSNFPLLYVQLDSSNW